MHCYLAFLADNDIVIKQMHLSVLLLYCIYFCFYKMIISNILYIYYLNDLRNQRFFNLRDDNDINEKGEINFLLMLCDVVTRYPAHLPTG